MNASINQISSYYALDIEGGGCTGPNGTGTPLDNVYQAFANDPSITGFQNSYNWSINMVYTIPPAP